MILLKMTYFSITTSLSKLQMSMVNILVSKPPYQKLKLTKVNYLGKIFELKTNDPLTGKIAFGNLWNTIAQARVPIVPIERTVALYGRIVEVVNNAREFSIRA